MPARLNNTDHTNLRRACVTHIEPYPGRFTPSEGYKRGSYPTDVAEFVAFGSAFVAATPIGTNRFFE